MYLTQGLHRAVQRHPGRVALTHLDEGLVRRHTHAQLADGVARHAAALAARGIGPGDRVALLAPNNDLLVRALLACWWLGAVACPLNTRWTAAELAYALDDSDSALVLADPALDALVASTVMLWPPAAIAVVGVKLKKPEAASAVAVPICTPLSLMTALRPSSLAIRKLPIAILALR